MSWWQLILWALLVGLIGFTVSGGPYYITLWVLDKLDERKLKKERGE